MNETCDIGQKPFTLIVPVMYGKAEAWRRFFQELQGSRREEFVVWCQRLRLQVEHLWLSDSVGGTTIVLKVLVTDQRTALIQSGCKTEAVTTNSFLDGQSAIPGDPPYTIRHLRRQAVPKTGSTRPCQLNYLIGEHLSWR